MAFHTNKSMETLYKEGVEICGKVLKCVESFCFHILNDEEVFGLFEIVSIFKPYFNHFSCMTVSYFYFIMYYPIMLLVSEPDH